MKEVGARICLFRLLRELEPGMMAQHLRMTVPAYMKIEGGDTDITISRLEHIADILSVPIHRFFDVQEVEA